jgi:hypothetical protein
MWVSEKTCPLGSPLNRGSGSTLALRKRKRLERDDKQLLEWDKVGQTPMLTWEDLPIPKVPHQG